MKVGKTSMNPYERCIATAEGCVPDRVPAYTPSTACDVASKILGREAHTGSPTLWYASAKAWLAGPNAYAEFQQKHEEDIIELNSVNPVGMSFWSTPVTLKMVHVDVNSFQFSGGVSSATGCAPAATLMYSVMFMSLVEFSVSGSASWFPSIENSKSTPSTGSTEVSLTTLMILSKGSPKKLLLWARRPSCGV